ncbi:MAG: NAD(P)H-dependent oxidoreductase subunit E [Nitrospirae bacterium]|nr:NAD(P)H-dependent oxidoreductase subunit E [Nitrospirota bacterium]
MLEVSPEVEKKLDGVLQKHITDEGNIISLLQDMQEAFGYIPEKAVGWFSKKLDIPESRFYGVITFYSQFHTHPRGRNLITACCGTACHVKGSERLINSLRRELNIVEEEDTTDDRKFTVEKVACIGTCSMAPAVIINKKIYGNMTADKLMKMVKTLEGKKNED